MARCLAASCSGNSGTAGPRQLQRSTPHADSHKPPVPPEWRQHSGVSVVCHSAAACPAAAPSMRLRPTNAFTSAFWRAWLAFTGTTSDSHRPAQPRDRRWRLRESLTRLRESKATIDGVTILLDQRLSTEFWVTRSQRWTCGLPHRNVCHRPT